MSISNVLERKKTFFFAIVVAIVLAIVFLPTMFVRATSIGTNVSVTGTLTVTDTSTFTGAATFNGNVTVGDLATADTLTITARLAADLDPDANNTIDLGAFGLAYNNIVASGTLFLSSVTSTQITPWANNTSDFGAYEAAWKDVFVSGTLYAGTLNQWDTNLTLGGNFTAGNVTSSDIVYLNSRIASSMIPTVNNSEDVGEFGRSWNDVFASGTAWIATLTVDGNTTLGNGTSDTLTVTARLAADLDPNANGTIDLGAFDLAYDNIFTSGTAWLAGVKLGVDGTMTLGTSTANTLTVTARLAADLDPNANGTIDLGAFDLAYDNIFTSGTAWLAGVNFGVDGTMTLGTSTANTLTVTARLAADLDPSSHNERDLGAFGLAYRDIYVSSTAFVGDLSDLLYIDKVNSRVGVASSTPSAQLSIGTGGGVTSTISVGKFCMYAGQEDGVNVYVYMPIGAEAGEPFATTTVSCF